MIKEVITVNYQCIWYIFSF